MFTRDLQLRLKLIRSPVVIRKPLNNSLGQLYTTERRNDYSYTRTFVFRAPVPSLFCLSLWRRVSDLVLK